jgi:hypothetical protein
MTSDELIAAIESASSLMLGAALEQRVPGELQALLSKEGWELDELARRYWEEKEEGDSSSHLCGQPNSHCDADCMARAGACGVYDMPLEDLTEDDIDLH